MLRQQRNCDAETISDVFHKNYGFGNQLFSLVPIETEVDEGSCQQWFCFLERRHEMDISSKPDSPFSHLLEDCKVVSESNDTSMALAAEKMMLLGEMGGSVTHDIRNLLSVIECGLRVAEDDPTDVSRLRECFTAVYDAVALGLRLTSGILHLTTPNEMSVENADLNKLIDRLLLMLKLGGGSGVKVALSLAPGLPWCKVEPTQFNAALLNLVVNARDAMPSGGTLEISTCSDKSFTIDDKSYVRVRVKDDGVGMSSETQSRIFDRHFTTKGDAGTGLGMPQVRSLMDLVGGHIRIQSSIGSGTVFDLYFPALPQPSGNPDFATDGSRREVDTKSAAVGVSQPLCSDSGWARKHLN